MSALTALTAQAAVFPSGLRAQLAPPATGGVVEFDRLLQRIAEPRRILVIGAHPDDEDTELLALAAQGYGARAAYLALSRGEGGQNLIGEELGEALGLLRSQELLAARATDGAWQFFTRAYDFGFSKSLEETLRFWPADTLLKDAVRVARLFRPHLIVSVFSGTPRDGHGQHQAAGLTAQRVFDAAGDPARFPELLREEGLRPWQPLRLYQSTRFDTTRTTVRLPTGALDPRSGRSYHQIAMASRSLHRSQDMGQLQRLGPAQARMGLIQDRTGITHAGSADDLFAGIKREETWLTALADSLRGVTSPGRMAQVASVLAKALSRLDPEPDVADSVTRAELERALAVAAGLEIDALATTEEVVAGDRVDVVLQVYNGGAFDLRVDSGGVVAPAGWRVEAPDAGPMRLTPGTLETLRFRVTVPPDARPSQPYFLDRPREGGLYDWSGAPPSVRGRPFEPPLFTARVAASILGAHVMLAREVSYRFNDQAYGEIRRPLRVVPAVDVRLDPDVVVWPAGGSPTRAFTVTLSSHARAAISGEVRLVANGWPSPPAVSFTLDQAGDSRVVTLDLARPSAVTRAAVTVAAVARTSDGHEFRDHTVMVAYPHIRPTQDVRGASGGVRVEPMALPPLTRVGYIRGASDRVPEALQQVGLPVVLLTPQDLADGDLSRFDAIVVGSRAYETDTALVRHNQRVLAYARQGGLVVVQYQQYPFVQGRFAPYPLTIARPHDRVTDEAAPVQLLDLDHPAFTTPNRIEAADWDGWPQERGLYFARTWDAAYTPLLEMADPGESPLQGGLLAARVGLGTYVYTGLAFFRALPAGVPGAFRIFLNLLALR
ncbi:MAG: PIG-L family deacetylase [Gemmatimonadetes bacterium]|nr:PIG-L family deacetylase [Gemmatimonadota bacterium]